MLLKNNPTADAKAICPKKIGSSSRVIIICTNKPKTNLTITEIEFIPPPLSEYFKTDFLSKIDLFPPAR